MNLTRAEEYIKSQARIFLLEMRAFYPFGCAIDDKNNLRPLSAYIEGENPSPVELIDLLEGNIVQKIEIGEYVMGIVAIDVTISNENVKQDAIEMRIFIKDEKTVKKHLIYKMTEGDIEFWESPN